MTTRRRRAGSESYVEEQTAPGAVSTQNPQQFPVNPQPPFALLPQWGSPSVNVSTGEAYYKKTDTVNPLTAGQEVGIPYSWPAQPGQQLWNPGHSNTLTATQSYTNTTYTCTGGVAYSPDINQWNNSNSAVNIRSDWNNSTNANWNSGAVSKSGTWQNTEGQSNAAEQWNTRSASQFPCEGSLVSSVEDSDMASRDRTQEFVRIVRSQQGSQSNGAIPHQEGKRPRDIRQYTDFMQRAKLIGRNISSTYAKLEKLTHLAKKRSLFDDSHDREIQDLTGIIRHDLTSLTKQLGDLHNRSHIASPVANNAHLQKHSSNLVGSLQTKVAVITQKFKDVLEVRTENLKKQAERRDQFTGGVVSGELPPGAMAGHHQGSVLLASEAAAYNTHHRDHTTSNGDVAINLDNSGAYQQQLQLMEEQDTYLQSRADTMRTIESTIVELGQMFTQLAEMVKHQEELVHRIDANVDDAELNVEGAHSELLKYFKSVSSNRMLMIKVFGIMIVFFVIFVVFMA